MKAYSVGRFAIYLDREYALGYFGRGYSKGTIKVTGRTLLQEWKRLDSRHFVFYEIDGQTCSADDLYRAFVDYAHII